MEARLVAIQKYQLDTFFFAMHHMPVYAVAEAKASAKGIASGAKALLAQSKAVSKTK